MVTALVSPVERFEKLTNLLRGLCFAKAVDDNFDGTEEVFAGHIFNLLPTTLDSVQVVAHVVLTASQGLTEPGKNVREDFLRQAKSQSLANNFETSDSSASINEGFLDLLLNFGTSGLCLQAGQNRQLAALGDFVTLLGEALDGAR